MCIESLMDSLNQNAVKSQALDPSVEKQQTWDLISSAL